MTRFLTLYSPIKFHNNMSNLNELKEFIMQIEFLTALKNLRLAAGVLQGASQTAMMGLLILLKYTE